MKKEKKVLSVKKEIQEVLQEKLEKFKEDDFKSFQKTKLITCIKSRLIFLD